MMVDSDDAMTDKDIIERRQRIGVKRAGVSSIKTAGLVREGAGLSPCSPTNRLRQADRGRGRPNGPRQQRKAERAVLTYHVIQPVSWLPI
jgi:hypothetical protein